MPSLEKDFHENWCKARIPKLLNPARRGAVHYRTDPFEGEKFESVKFEVVEHKH